MCQVWWQASDGLLPRVEGLGAGEASLLCQHQQSRGGAETHYSRILSQCGDERRLQHDDHSLLLSYFSTRLKFYLSLENISLTCDVAGCQVFALTHTDNTVDGVTLHSNGWILQPASPDKEFPPPELFSHSLNSGQKLYGMIYKPHNAVPGKRWEISCK